MRYSCLVNFCLYYLFFALSLVINLKYVFAFESGKY